MTVARILARDMMPAMKSWQTILATAVLGMVALAAAAKAEGEMRASTAKLRRELITVVEAQLEAFRDGNLKKAYGYASRALQAQRPLRLFLAIVEANYPEIWANTKADFGLARDDGQRATITVVVHADEDRASYDFMLIRERAGWRIEGVLRRTPSKGKQV